MYGLKECDTCVWEWSWGCFNNDKVVKKIGIDTGVGTCC